ncbi:hypothetical protein T231_08695, partial [Tannerella sp. oral taxon BU063 isolate Cell 6/7/9]
DQIRAHKLEWTFDFSGSYPFMKMLEKQADGSVSSWAVRWYASALLKDKLTLYPGRSLIFHNGSDGSGTNYSGDNALDVKLSDRPIVLERLLLEEDKNARKAFIGYFRYAMLWHKIQ